MDARDQMGAEAVIPVIALLAGLLLLATAAVPAARGISRRRDKQGTGRDHLTASALALAPAATALGVAGVLPVLMVVLGVLSVVVAAALVLTYPQPRRGSRYAAALVNAFATFGRPAPVLRATDASPRRRSDRVVPPPGPAPSIPGRRAVPPVRSDPALANTPLARAVTSGPVSSAWRMLIEEVADFEPEDETEFLAHWQQQATGFLAYADAILDQADTLGEGGLGLAPAIIAAMFDGAEVIGDGAHDVAAIRERYLSSYEGAREDVADGHPLPKDGRFVTGEDAA